MRESLRRWLPVGLWIGLILALGQESFSADATRSRLEPLLRFLGFGPEAIETAHVVIRKGAHLGEYAGLGVLTERALAGAAPPARAARAAALALAVAATDEGLQALSPERTGSPFDLVLDLAGAGLGVALARGWRGRGRAGYGRVG